VEIKLSVEQKMNEYIEFLVKDNSFVVEEQDNERSFSNGKKIGPFFKENHKEIIRRLFVDHKYKGKVEYFKARAKVIDYISSHNVKSIKDSCEIILKYLKEQQNIEDTLRCVSISMSNDGNIKFDIAQQLYMEYHKYDDDTEYDIEDYLNNCGESFAKAAEKLLKSFIIYNEGINSPIYTYSPLNIEELKSERVKKDSDKKPIIGSSRWRKELNQKGKYGALRSESSILGLIKERINNHELVLPNLDKRLDLNERGLLSTSGHNLYSLYQLLDPVSKALVNSEFFVYDQKNPDNKNKSIGMLAILTENIEYGRAGTQEINKDLQENSNAFVNARYADIDLKNVKPNELEFLKRLSTSLQAICKYKFPLRKAYDQIDFEKYDIEKLNEEIVYGENNQYKKAKYPFFYKLDKVLKYYLMKYFDAKELDIFNKYCETLYERGLNYIQCEQFVNIAIFFKHYIVNNLNEDLFFETIVFDNLMKYFDSIKDFDLFNGETNNLFANEFFSEKNVARLKKEVEITKKLDTKYKKITIEERKRNSALIYALVANNLLDERQLEEIKKKSVHQKKEKILPIDIQINTFIRMLNKGNSQILKNGNKESLEGYPNVKLSGFWALYKKHILPKLFVELMDKHEYDNARDTILSYYNVKSYDELISLQTLTRDEMIKIFIKMLNKGNTNILKNRNNETLEGYPSINLAYFFRNHQLEIIKKLFIEFKDNKEYDKARLIILKELYLKINNEKYINENKIDKTINNYIYNNKINKDELESARILNLETDIKSIDSDDGEGKPVPIKNIFGHWTDKQIEENPLEYIKFLERKLKSSYERHDKDEIKKILSEISKIVEKYFPDLNGPENTKNR